MPPTNVLHYDAFTTVPGKGNPAGVVLDCAGLSSERMLEIAHAVGFSETAFVVRSTVADLRLRFFTPGFEIDLCGHATMASFSALVAAGSLTAGDYLMETLAGILPIHVETSAGGPPEIMMRQASPRFEPFEGSLDDLAAAIGLTSADIDTSLPIVYGSTGNWTLVIPIRTLDAFSRMTPHNARFPDVMTAMPRASVHPFCRETHDPDANLHARHFASPHSRLVEDPVTGTASGVLGAYWARWIAPGEGEYRLLVEQGHEMGRDGSVRVTIVEDVDETQVSITGTAVYSATLTIA
jgi:PhzF family phenazine biosynthesis protein